jgi:hypothetical protein
MNRSTYQQTRRSIRDNGIRYTLQHAIYTDNTDAIFVCDDIANVMCETDWLAMRAMFVRTGEKPAVAFRLTCDKWLSRREMDKPIVWGN